MKTMLRALRNVPKRTTALVAVLLGTVLIPAALYAYGPERPTYTIEQPADHVTFNSITNNPTYGDEREFVTVQDTTTGSTFTGKAALTPGHTYKVQMYIHNDAATKYNSAEHNHSGIARNTTVRAYLPKSVSGSDTVDGYVSASNAAPKTVFDTAALTSDKAVNIEYVANSAMLHTWKQQTALSNELFSANGTLVGSGDVAGKDLSGNWNGCIDYAATVTYEFKVSAPETPDFSVSKTVSAHGANKFGETVATKPGDLVDFRIRYQNTGNVQQNDVVVKDALPKGLTYVPGTSSLITSKTPNGSKMSDNVVTKSGANIGSYAPTGAGYVTFTAKVDGNDTLPVCGPNTLTNTATVETDNGSKSDTADVTVPKECTPPVKKVPACNMETGVIEQVDEGKANTAPHTTNLDKCSKVTVCDTTTGAIVTVTKDDAEDSKYTTDLSKCQPAPETPTTPETPSTPETPAELPHTGMSDVAASVVGAGSLIAAISYYVISRRALHN